MYIIDVIVLLFTIFKAQKYPSKINCLIKKQQQINQKHLLIDF